MNIQMGELAALATSLSFATGSVFFTLAGRRFGSLVLNRLRLLAALALLSLAHWFLLGSPTPVEAGPQQWFWLGLSGVVGLVIGDLMLLQAYIWNGPRLTMLMMSLSPVLSALLAWLFLDQTLSGGQILGILITLSGIVWVVGGKPAAEAHQAQRSPHYLRGVLFGLGAAICQSLGLVLARQGLGESFSPLSGNLIRMSSAALAMWLLTIFQGQVGQTIQAVRREPGALRLMLVGAFAAPFLGVWLSLVAIQNAELGVASTLMALPPVLLLPVSYFLFKERFGWQAVAGTLLAMSGIAILFLV